MILRLPILILMWSVTSTVAAQDTTYYQDLGVMKSIGLSIDDQRVGDWNFYYVSGALSAQLVYSEGSLDGKQQYYYPNGSLRAIETWGQDALKDSAFYYHETGALEKKWRYFNNLYMGLW